MDSETVLLAIFCLIKKYKQSYSSFYQEELRRKIFKLYALYITVINEENSKKNRQCWVRSIFTVQRRILQGASDNLVQEMDTEDKEKFVNYFRMHPLLLAITETCEL